MAKPSEPEVPMLVLSASAIAAVSVEFAHVLRTPLSTDKLRYLRELVAVTRAAAIGGEYRDALKGYEVIGKTLGHISDSQQHLHVHAGSGAPLTDRSDSELMDMMDVPRLPLQDDPTRDELAAFLAELDRVPVA